MIHRIAVSSKVEDARAESLLRNLKVLVPQSALEGASYVQAYTIDAELSQSELQRVAERLTHPVTEIYSIDKISTLENFSYVIEVGYLAGVTDNVGRTARETIEDCLGRSLGDGGVYSSFFLFLSGTISEPEAKSMARELHNPLIERANVYPVGADFKIIVPRVELHEYTDVHEVSLDVDDAELSRIGKEGIRNADGTRRGPLALSVARPEPKSTTAVAIHAKTRVATSAASRR